MEASEPRLSARLAWANVARSTSSRTSSSRPARKAAANRRASSGLSGNMAVANSSGVADGSTDGRAAETSATAAATCTGVASGWLKPGIVQLPAGTTPPDQGSRTSAPTASRPAAASSNGRTQKRRGMASASIPGNRLSAAWITASS